jgi:hypothetical protein
MKKITIYTLLATVIFLSSCNLKPEIYDRIITNAQLIDGLSQSYKNRTITDKELETVRDIIIKNSKDPVACKSAFLAIYYLEKFTVDQLKKECE